ncbi:MAG: tRNA (adenosine(37)-N6)-threonylcarbamoyltransferase complex ATPase subunit type 1 TsaE [Sphingomonas sp.]|nr:tRNA (adenosine(37)-N6)-threonylcarbamoyltransferase complex ATPase subunit type 1 TsaE [Sphingomonas sp.]
MIELADPAASARFGAWLADRVQPGDVITLAGPLGAGKTSIARGLLATLGLVGEAPSPSFAIVQPYDPPEVRLPVLHVDLYRIDSPDEMAELGLDEAAQDGLLIVEWPERAGSGYWPHALAVTIATDGDRRRLTAQVPEGWRARWAQR